MKIFLVLIMAFSCSILQADETNREAIYERLDELRNRIEQLNLEVELGDVQEKRILLMRLQKAEGEHTDLLQNFARKSIKLDRKEKQGAKKDGVKKDSVKEDGVENDVSGISVLEKDPRLVKLITAEPARIRSILRRFSQNLNLPDGDETASELAAIDAKLKATLHIMDNWYDVLLQNLTISEDLGIDVASEKLLLKRAIRERAANASSYLELTMQDLKGLQDRAKLLPEDQETQSLYAVTAALVATAAGELKIVIDDMTSLDLDATQYQSQLIVATGSISQDLFAVDVFSDLAAGWLAIATDWLRTKGLSLIINVIAFVLIIIISRFLSGWVRKGTEAALKLSTKPISMLLQRMLISTAGSSIYVIGILIALSQLGISLGPLLTGLGIVGFVIGFALQDTLSNFASGLMILFYRPFDVGDLIDAADIYGEVSKMNLVNTTILTLDNQTLIVPNSKIWGNVIKNVTDQKVRRVDLTFGIGYADDIDKAQKVLEAIVEDNQLTLKEPAAMIKLHELGDSSVNFIVRPWVNTADYWDVYWGITRSVKIKFDEAGISIPFPQQDVHILKDESA